MNLQGLPEHLRTDPHLTSWRLDHLENRVDALENQPDPQMVETPVGKFPIQLVIIALLALLIFRPDLVSKLIP
jgi:hypothetical protein